MDSIMKMWLYCNKCGYQKEGVYFNPTVCPKCHERLGMLQLTKSQYERCKNELNEKGCRDFVAAREESSDGSDKRTKRAGK